VNSAGGNHKSSELIYLSVLAAFVFSAGEVAVYFGTENWSLPIWIGGAFGIPLVLTGFWARRRYMRLMNSLEKGTDARFWKTFGLAMLVKLIFTGVGVGFLFQTFERTQALLGLGILVSIYALNLARETSVLQSFLCRQEQVKKHP
jgi:hypothetical protein